MDETRELPSHDEFGRIRGENRGARAPCDPIAPAPLACESRTYAQEWLLLLLITACAVWAQQTEIACETGLLGEARWESVRSWVVVEIPNPGTRAAR